MEEKTAPVPAQTAKPKKKRHWGKKHTIAAIIGGLLAVIVIFIGISAMAAISFKNKAQSTLTQAKAVQAAIQAQDLVTAKVKLIPSKSH